MKVPNAENAVVEISKLRDYCLNLRHEVGGHKARVFASALNLTDRDAEVLRTALLEAVRSETAKPGKPNAFGQVFVVNFEMSNDGKTAVVSSVWMIKTGLQIPELITCLIL